jgi:AraC-like DNA-binding protein
MDDRALAQGADVELARLRSPTMLASWTRAAAAAVSDQLSLEQRAGLLRERVPYALALQVWQCCEQAAPEGSFGLAFVQRLQLADLGVTGYLAASSADVGSALRRVVRYHRLFKEPSQLELCEEDAGLCVIERPPAGVVWPAALAEAVLGGYVEFLRRLTSTALVPVRVSFQHSARPWTALHRAFFGEQVAFDQPAHSLVLAPTDVRRPLSTRDATLLALLLPAADAQLATLQEEDALLSRVAQEIACALPDGYPELSTSARRLAMSMRSLQRQLAARGLRYQDLVDQVRRERATRLLREPGRSIDEVAFLVGFADASGLRRAFRRWSGVSPQALKRAASAGGVIEG